MASYAALLLTAIKTYGMNAITAAGRLPLWRRHKPPLRLSAAQLIANLRKDIEELDAVPSGMSRRKTDWNFLPMRSATASARNSLLAPKPFWTVLGHDRLSYISVIVCGYNS